MTAQHTRLERARNTRPLPEPTPSRGVRQRVIHNLRQIMPPEYQLDWEELASDDLAEFWNGHFTRGSGPLREGGVPLFWPPNLELLQLQYDPEADIGARAQDTSDNVVPFTRSSFLRNTERSLGPDTDSDMENWTAHVYAYNHRLRPFRTWRPPSPEPDLRDNRGISRAAQPPPPPASPLV